MRVNEMNYTKLGGLLVYLSGIGLGIARPPVERLACMEVPSGEVCTGINTPLLVIELFLVMLGAILMAFSTDFRNTRQLNGWLGVATGLGIAFVGGYAGLGALTIFGAALATLGLILYKWGERE